MPVLFILFRITLWQWYDLKAFTEDLNEYQSYDGISLDYIKTFHICFHYFKKCLKCFHYYLAKQLRCYCHPSTRFVVGPACTVRKMKIFENVNIRDKMTSKEILSVRNCIHMTVILYFHLELLSKSVSWQILGLNLVKLDCMIITWSWYNWKS